MSIFYIILIVVIILSIALRAFQNNENYTIGSGLFKRSDHNLDKDEKLDVCDYDYYKNGNDTSDKP